MIKLVRPIKPRQLDEETISLLTQRFIDNPNDSVWNQPYIKEALMKSSHEKCCYCECKSDKGDLHIEHFHPKSLYPNEVVCWENLLLSCSKCNRAKGTLDTVTNRLVNPYDDDPKEYIGIDKNYILRGIDKNGIGEFFINSIYKNGYIFKLSLYYHTIYTPFQIDLEELYKTYKIKDIGRNAYSLVSKLCNILEMVQSNKPYSAALSALVINNPNFIYLKTKIENSLSDDLISDFKFLYNEAVKNALKYLT
mgnify:FL=1